MVAFIRYLFKKPVGDAGRICTAWCRYKRHPCGVVWYNPMGSEPDMRCKYCGDDLG